MNDIDTPRESRPARTSGRGLRLALSFWSLTAVVAGLWQLTDPSGGPFSGAMHRFIIPFDWAPAPLLPAALIAAGLAGLALPLAPRRMWPLTAAYAVVFGFCVPTVTVISLAGYLAVFLVFPALVALPVLLARGLAGKLATAVGVAAVLVVLAATGPLDPGMVRELLTEIVIAGGDLGPRPLAELWSAAGGALWAAFTVRLWLAARGGALPAWLRPEGTARWGRVASYVAAASALPYGLSRMTWLLPGYSGVFAPEGLADDPGTRLWGLMLGFACLGGGVLCLGLTQRWGERWPFWVPGLRGRPVPPKVAIIPAAVVAYLFCIAAVSTTGLAIDQADARFVLFFAFPVWGPALAAATLAYAVRRRAISPWRGANSQASTNSAVTTSTISPPAARL